MPWAANAADPVPADREAAVAHPAIANKGKGFEIEKAASAESLGGFKF
jgi:hypothetical protein